MTDTSDEMAKILGKLDAKTRKRVMMASEVAVETLATPSVRLNLALGGGLRWGQQHMFWGNKQGGKTSFCFQTIGNAQREGKRCAYIDVEGGFDPRWAKKLGVDTENLFLSKAKTVSDATQDCIEFIESGVDLFVVDSTSALLGSVFFEKDSQELKRVEDTKQIGAASRDLGQMLAILNYASTPNTMQLYISQMRNNIATYGAIPQPMGGIAFQHYMSTIVKFWTNPADKEQIKGDVYQGDRIFTSNVGRPINWTLEKSRSGSPGHTGKIDFYYEGVDLGFDKVGEVFDIAVEHEIIKKSGAWFDIYGQTVQGRPAAVNAVKAEPELVEKLEGEVYARI